MNIAKSRKNETVKWISAKKTSGRFQYNTNTKTFRRNVLYWKLGQKEQQKKHRNSLV